MVLWGGGGFSYERGTPADADLRDRRELDGVDAVDVDALGHARPPVVRQRYIDIEIDIDIDVCIYIDR